MGDELILENISSENRNLRYYYGTVSQNYKQLDLHAVVSGNLDQAVWIKSVFETEPVSALLPGGIAGVNKKLYRIAVDQPKFVLSAWSGIVFPFGLGVKSCLTSEFWNLILVALRTIS